MERRAHWENSHLVCRTPPYRHAGWLSAPDFGKSAGRSASTPTGQIRTHGVGRGGLLGGEVSGPVAVVLADEPAAVGAALVLDDSCTGHDGAPSTSPGAVFFLASSVAVRGAGRAGQM